MLFSCRESWSKNCPRYMSVRLLPDIAREHQITPAVMNYSDTVTHSQKRNVPLEVIIPPQRMTHNNSDEKSLLNMCVCCRLTTTDTYAFTHFHIHNLLHLQQLPGFRSCAPRPIRSADSSLYKATAPFIKVYQFTVYA